MFGKPEWFVEKRWGWGLTPVSWQGWGYTGAWAAAMVVPFTAFLIFHRWPEGFVWMGAMLALLVWDVKQIVAAKNPRPKKDVLFIGDDDADAMQTNKLDLRLKR